eukprot:CAMPEP_0167796296 /NCGR_PEP_ID=MMETSP0111_2-20121227/14958_1 /TAXON_ID=91324 /ORGANISM="Lotharella globosa, Strain CCCM811" /LENGTH=117 /DNA_ID=CAMNT_0007690151 /DNA_START=665 /DNA_END=1015 /DNA_ORIENTATION=+
MPLIWMRASRCSSSSESAGDNSLLSTAGSGSNAHLSFIASTTSPSIGSMRSTLAADSELTTLDFFKGIAVMLGEFGVTSPPSLRMLGKFWKVFKRKGLVHPKITEGSTSAFASCSVW